MRYVYQPLEDLYIVLITNLQSNILQDIDTLHLLAPLVVASVRTVDERDVLLNCFEIISAFDEVLTLGYKENLQLSQVKTYLEMESHEEKIHNIIERNKEIEVAQKTKIKAQQIEATRAKNAEIKRFGYGEDDFRSKNSVPSFTSSAPDSVRSISPAPSSSVTRPATSAPRKGLLLGKKKNDGLDSLRGAYESESQRLLESDKLAKSKKAPAAVVPSGPVNKGISIVVQEDVAATIARMGDIQSADVKGSLQLQIGDPALTNIQIILKADASGSHYRTHPNVDKPAFLSQKVLKVKDARRSFPGNNQQLSVLRWSLAANGTAGSPKPEELVPIEFHCWFSAGDNGTINGIVEYELAPGFDATLTNIRLQIPLLSGDVTVTSPDQTWNQYDDEIEWIINEIVPGTESAAGSLEWTAEANSEDDFFPMQVSFKSSAREPAGKVQVLDVVDESGASVEFKHEIVIESGNVQIV